MKTRLTVGVAAALVLMTSNAVADGMYRRAPAPVAAADCCEPVRTWRGFYLGAGVGAGAVVHELTVDDVFKFDGVGGEGIFGTVIAGYDFQLSPKTVFGIFVDYDFSGIETELDVGGGAFSASLEHDHSWSVGARLGWLYSPSTLWYVLGGYTQAEYELDTSVTLPSFINDKLDFDGWFVGAGVESQLHSNWSLRLEYRYTQFGDESLINVDDFSVDLEPSMHTARLVLSYKFGDLFGHRREVAPVPMK